MDAIGALVEIALDLTKALSAEDRYDRLLEVWGRVVPFDAATLLRLDEGILVPVAARGLKPDALARRYPLKENPRLEIICNSEEPVRFPADSSLPDPFDGLLEHDPHALHGVHACLGCPLRVGDDLIGALTADSLTVAAFDNLDQRFLAATGALAGSALRTTALIEALEESAERQGLIARDLMRDIQLRRGHELIGTSEPMKRLRKEIDLVARSDFAVLITGETGSGKELVARAIHGASSRRDHPLIYVNCAALPESLAESELFGHLRGAFTGAESDRPGKFEVADGGTLFLDEVGELPLIVQPKLLRALQEGEIQRVGADRPHRADVRILTATNRDLEAEVRAGRFRADLFHRLNVYPLRVPALRERREDVALLAGYFCDLARRRLGFGPVRLTPGAIAALKNAPWPGNVRELENVLSRAVLHGSSGIVRGAPLEIAASHLAGNLDNAAAEVAAVETGSPSSDTVHLRRATEEFQRSLIRQAVAANGGNWAAAARSLGMQRSNLHHLGKRLGLR